MRNTKCNNDMPDIIKELSESPVEIPLDDINLASKSDAELIIDSLTSLFDDEFIKSNKKLVARIKSEIESLRILIKMRKSDEYTHDILLDAISSKPSNASLYRSLSEIQRTIVGITTKIDENIKSITQLLKAYQLEFEFSEKNNEDESIIGQHRGTKDFILKIKEKENEKNQNTIG